MNALNNKWVILFIVLVAFLVLLANIGPPVQEWAREKVEPSPPIQMSCRDGYFDLPQGSGQYKVVLVAPPCGDTWTAWYRQPLSARESKRMDILNHNVLDFELKFENGIQLVFEDWTPVDEGEFRFTPITDSSGRRRRPQIVGFRVRNKMREPTRIEVLVSPRKNR